MYHKRDENCNESSQFDDEVDEDFNDATGASKWNFENANSTVYANDYPECSLDYNNTENDIVSVAPGKQNEFSS